MLEVGKWALSGGLLSAAIDLDVYAAVLLKSKKQVRLRPFRSLLKIHRKFKAFMDTIAETGVLKSGMISHFILSLAFIFLSYFFWNAYFIPVTLGVVSHIISDIPNILRVIRTGDRR